MLKAAIDTSVLISGLINSRSSRQVLIALENSRFTPVLSPAMLKELLDVLARAKFHQVILRETASSLVETLKAQALFVNPRIKIDAVVRDKNDNMFLEAAISAKADCVVSLDDDLLSLKNFRDIPVMRPQEFLKKI